MNRLLLYIVRYAIGRKLIGLIAGINTKLSGHRTELLGLLYGLIYVLKKLGMIPPDLVQSADSLAVGILGAIPITLAEKARKVDEIINGIIPERGNELSH